MLTYFTLDLFWLFVYWQFFNFIYKIMPFNVSHVVWVVFANIYYFFVHPKCMLYLIETKVFLSYAATSKTTDLPLFIHRLNISLPFKYRYSSDPINSLCTMLYWFIWYLEGDYYLNIYNTIRLAIRCFCIQLIRRI